MENKYDNIGLYRKYQKAITILNKYEGINTTVGKFKKWNGYEISFLLENFQEIKYKEISKILNRTVSAIKGKIKILKLKKARVYENAWNNAEIKFLVENYPKYGCEYCFNFLEKTKSSIYGAANKYKLKKIK